MSNQYIPQINNQNFVYPNYELAEYDVDIIHDINNNSVSGVLNSFSATTVTTSVITISYDVTWIRNDADLFIRDVTNNISYLSIHAMAPSQSYYNPWRVVQTTSYNTYTGQTTLNASAVGLSVSASQLGLTSFTNGVYNFEFRFIGATSVYTVCTGITISGFTTPTPTPTATPTPTPSPTPTRTATPTPTPGGPTPTPTPTPTVTPTPTPSGAFTSGATINVTDTGYIKYVKKGNVDATYVYIASLGNYTITDCLTCSTIMIGIPFADVANFTLITCGAPC